MHPLIIHLIIVAVSSSGAIVLGHPAPADGTPAMRFWEQALPGTPMPAVIADLVQKGIDHSPLTEHYPINDDGTGDTAGNNAWNWRSCRRCQQKGADKGFYFLMTQVRVGSTLTFTFRRALIAPILPHDVAAKVPFDDLANVLTTFHVDPSSAEAATVNDTLSVCQVSPVDGEKKVCTTSLEDTVKSAKQMLLGTGSSGVMTWAAASATRSNGLPLQPYVIQAVAPLDGDRHVGCHILPYPYGVYYCHMTPAMPTKAYMVSLQGVSGGAPAVDMVAICHFNTSNWDPSHPAFQMLHTHPGGKPVCHFMAYANMLFGKKKAEI